MTPTDIFSRFVAGILKPIEREPFFIAVITLCLSFSPFAWALAPGHDVVLRMMVYAVIRGFFIAYILAAIVTVSRWKWLKIPVYVIAALLFIVDSTATFVNHMTISPSSVTMVANTTVAEISGYFSEYFSIGKFCFLAVVVILLSGIIIYGEKKNLRLSIVCKKPFKIITLGVLGISILINILWFIDFSTVFRLSDTHKVEGWASDLSFDPALPIGEQVNKGDIVSKLVYTAVDLKLQSDEMSDWEEILKETCATATFSRDSQPLDIVIIFGESFKKDHSSLYGYDKQTNPCLEKEAGDSSLFPFTNYISAANFTSGSIKNTLSLNSLGDGESWNESPFFPLIMKNAGFNVYWFENQSLSMGNDNLSFHQGAFLFNKFLVDNCFDEINDSIFQYDGDFIRYINRKYPVKTKRNLIVYHIIGQHFPANYRYPDDSFANRWNHTDITLRHEWLDDRKRQAIAEYDNATLYNDSVVAGVISEYRDRNAVILYFSDHGIDMYDDFNVDIRSERSTPGEDKRPWVKRNFEIPFFIWVSDKYKENYPDKLDAIRKSTNRPAMLDNLGQTVLGLGNVESVYYKGERDLLSDKYECPPRITVGGYDFDSIMSSGQ